MADFPYTPVTGKLKSLFEKIQQVGKPSIVDKKWLASIGFGASNDYRVVPVIKFIGFVDQLNKPTDRWMAYRGDKNQARKILAEGIREGYTELFRVYPDAYRRSDDELRSFFSTRTEGGSQVISATVTTFKTLCDLADFSDILSTEIKTPEILLPESVMTAPIETSLKQKVNFTPALQLNIEIHIAADTPEDKIEAIFKNMKKYLLSNEQ